MMQGARLAAFALTGFLSAGSADAFDPSFQPVDLTVRQISQFQSGSGQTRFGTLEFRGGLELSADDKRFGSWSGLDIAPDGTLTAISDRGMWLTGKLVEDAGVLAGLRNARMARMLDANGNAFIGKRNSDAEGLRIVRGKGETQAFVSFEGVNVVRRYVADPDFAHARAKPVKIPLAVGQIRGPDGIESVAIAPASSHLGPALVLIAEHSLDSAGNHRAWIVDGPRAGQFAILRKDDFNIADAAFLPGGDLLILERQFGYTIGLTMRIRRIAGADIRPGATVDGPVQIEANLMYQIDNMEGLSVRTGADGKTILDLISDDNGNHMLQRTLLLQFAIVDDMNVPPAEPVTASVPAAPALESLPPFRASTVPPIPRPRPQPAG